MIISFLYRLSIWSILILGLLIVLRTINTIAFGSSKILDFYGEGVAIAHFSLLTLIIPLLYREKIQGFFVLNSSFYGIKFPKVLGNGIVKNLFLLSIWGVYVFLMLSILSFINGILFGEEVIFRGISGLEYLFEYLEEVFVSVYFVIFVAGVLLHYSEQIKGFIVNRLISHQTKLTKVLGTLVVGNFIILCLFFLFFLFACAVFVSHGYCADWSALGYLVGLTTMGGILIVLLLLYIPIKLFTTK